MNGRSALSRKSNPPATRGQVERVVKGFMKARTYGKSREHRTEAHGHISTLGILWSRTGEYRSAIGLVFHLKVLYLIAYVIGQGTEEVAEQRML
jgi:hypothetical protein